MIPVVNSIQHGPSVGSSTNPSSNSIAKHKRKRKRTSAEQLSVLEGVFRTNQHPNLTLRNQLAAQLLMTPRGVQKWFQNRRAKARSQTSQSSTSSSSTSSLAIPSILDVNSNHGFNIQNATSSATTSTSVTPTTVSPAAMVAMNASVMLAKNQQKKRSENFRWSDWSQQTPGNDNNLNLNHIVGDASKSLHFDGLTPAHLLGIQNPINFEELYRFNTAVANHQIAVASQYAVANAVNNNNNSNNNNNKFGFPDGVLGGLNNNYFLSNFNNPNTAADFSSILPSSALHSALLAAGVPNSSVLAAAAAVANSSQNYSSLVTPVAMKMHPPQPQTSTQHLTPLSTSPPSQTSTNPILSSQQVTVPQSLSVSPQQQPHQLPTQVQQRSTTSQGLMLLSGLAGMISDQSPPNPLSAFSSRPANAQTPSFKDLLFAACTQSNEKRVLELIEQGVDVNCRDASGNSPLIVAAGFGFPELTAVLIKNKADVNAENTMGITAVYIAAKFGHQAALACLLEAGANPNTAASLYQETPLHAATFKGFIQIMKLLLQYNANVNAKDSKGKTPLHYHQGLTRVIKLLTSKDATVQATDTEGYTPLHYAVRDGQVSAALCLLEQGASIEERTKEGMTPLQLVCLHSSNTEMFDVLLEYDANPKAKSSDGRTCLHYAVEKGNLGIITTLIQKDINNLEEKDVNGITPLYLAQHHTNPNVLRHLQKCATPSHNHSPPAESSVPSIISSTSPSAPASPTSSSLTIAEEEEADEEDEDDEETDDDDEDEEDGEYKENNKMRR